MKDIRIQGNADQVSACQLHYDILIAACENEGTMVFQDSIVEHLVPGDQEGAPSILYRLGTREYVFPKHRTSKIADQSQVLEPGSADRSVGSVIRTAESYTYSSAKVDAHIMIFYDDAHGSPSFHIKDVMKRSALPKKVLGALERIVQDLGRARQ